MDNCVSTENYASDVINATSVANKIVYLTYDFVSCSLLDVLNCFADTLAGLLLLRSTA
jgi:hypothetical protein